MAGASDVKGPASLPREAVVPPTASSPGLCWTIAITESFLPVCSHQKRPAYGASLPGLCSASRAAENRAHEGPPSSGGCPLELRPVIVSPRQVPVSEDIPPAPRVPGAPPASLHIRALQNARVPFKASVKPWLSSGRHSAGVQFWGAERTCSYHQLLKGSSTSEWCRHFQKPCCI